VDPLLEYHIARNPSLGAIALWQFCRTFCDRVSQEDGPDLPTTMLVLPIVFHRESVLSVQAKWLKSGLLKVLAENEDFTAGLQGRVESLSELTLNSLALGCASSLLTVRRGRDWPHYLPVEKSLPSGLRASNEDVRGIISASKRLGDWFAQTDLVTLCSLLNIRF
jgi:hypothetical protein